jgi:tRNA-2-methylthio-N6-dimethylallyladenosine synthase
MKSRYQNNVFIETYGCQMNKYDSEIIAGILNQHNFLITHDINRADIVLINSCSVRKHAEQRILGRLGTLSHWKSKYSHRRLGLMGCMAQRLKEKILAEIPYLDLIIGPDQYRQLPDVLLKTTTKQIQKIHICETETYHGIYPTRNLKIGGWIAIMRGCDNFCSYCIVPYTRGRERSRSSESILQEIYQMVKEGYREVTLLGQNVNSYRCGEVDFPKLLKKVSQIDGLYRIRFMTSHPKDISDKLLETIASEQKICSHIHLPVQAGSNHILSLMNRKYTREKYLDLINKARLCIPGVSITSDIMVGFPGETEKDFEDTIQLMTEAQFDEAFTYYYSTREGTRAAKMENKLTKEEKLIRLNYIIQLQRRITINKKRQLIGNTMEILIESESKKSTTEWMGKTDTNHVVIFPKQNSLMGSLVHVNIQECIGTTLKGTIMNDHSTSSISKPGRKICGL